MKHRLRPASCLAVALAAALASAREPTHEANGMLGSTPETRAQTLSAFCLDRADNLLACDEAQKCVRVIAPSDKLLAVWKLDFAPQAVACRADGRVIVAGAGRVVLLDTNGTALAAAALPVPPMAIVKGRSVPREEVEGNVRYYASATAAAASGDDIFVCARGNGGYTVYRFDAQLGGRTAILAGLRGCCGQMDVTASDGTLYVAANCESKVVRYDREGRQIGSFGREKAGEENVFDGCCEPKNLCVGSDGTLYVAESAQCCVNRFTVDGVLLARVGAVKEIGGCVRVTVAVNRDASRVYMLDTNKNAIRVLERRKNS